MVVVELGTLGVLWVLWLAAGGLAADAISVVWISGCGYVNSKSYSSLSVSRLNSFPTDEIDTACREFSAIAAFGFLNWIIR